MKTDRQSAGWICDALQYKVLQKSHRLLHESRRNWQKTQNFNEQSALFLKYITTTLQVCPFLERASMGELRRNWGEFMKKTGIRLNDK